MQVKVNLTGTDEVINNLLRQQHKIDNALFDAVNAALQVLQADTKDMCVIGNEDETEGEHLVDSIQIKPAYKVKKSVIGKVYTRKKTAMHVEFGTSEIMMRPFLRPTLQKDKNKLKNMIKNAIKGELGL